ncbi:MAG: aldehyde dehydrogenase family protein, partial [Nitriliruptoraceae bacterium]
MATSTGRSPAATGWATTTSQPHLDAALATLRVRAADWQNTSLGRRIELLDATIATTVAQAADWVAVCADIQQTADTPWAPEGWLTGVVPVVRYLALLRDTLDDIATNGRPQPPRMGTRPDGQVVVEVLPTSSADRLLFRDYLAEVRVTPGVALPEAQSRMGRIYREPPADGPQVALVLGAGNVSSLAPLNVLHQLFAERRVALLKSHPVLAPLGPLIGAAFAPLVEEGVFRLVYGGSDVGAALARHNDVDTIHLTGSIATYNALQAAGAQPADDRDVADGAQPADDRDASDGAATITTTVRRLDKPVHAELGNVTPV